MTCVLAIDIGGTKLAAALVDEAGSMLRSATRPTPRTEVMSALAGLIAEVMNGGPLPEAAGIGCAGPLDLATGTVSPVNMPSWRGFPLREEVRKLTGLPTVLAGDAQCFALGEHWLGAGRGSTSLLGIVVSTGIGGGLVIDGAPLLGPTGNAGHVGHMSIDPNGERCECGGRGCVERYSSGPNLARWALEHGWSPHEDPTDPTGNSAGSGRAVSGTEAMDGQAEGADGRAGDASLRAEGASGKAGDAGLGAGTTVKHNGEKADARALARDAAAGDPVAVAAFERGARALAGMIASTAAAAEVTTVVIGGGVSAAGKVLFEPLERALDDVAGLAFVRAVQVRQSTLGVHASLAGAANLAWLAITANG
ncbi:ROK family protein [Nonomuraea sp. K274]|uniref:ROK family protein n=1 Tax=Nonomuraea cypriaca TaxID=1187855 RepID=A0A931A7G2_9ACTN|nr:ROK family protein [Nonomuraea cypriaca]MBF8187666.1 ROK family protein [Nonomuraea cypriaca]